MPEAAAPTSMGAAGGGRLGCHTARHEHLTKFLLGRRRQPSQRGGALGPVQKKWAGKIFFYFYKHHLHCP
jgi:hypothetical protein